MADQKLIKLKVNDREIQVPQGTLVIEATRRLGTEVPSFCYYPGLSLQAACRTSLVELEKAPKLQTACTLVATDGMVVRTDTDQVRQARKYMLEFLLTNHPLDCPVCDKGGECELQDMTYRYGADFSRFVEEKIHRPEEKWSELVYYDAPRCILCFRCVRVCDEGMDVKALGVGMRGANSVIIPNRGDHLECEECGMCIEICPVGALTSGTYRYKTRPWEMSYVSTVCTHCSNGCKTTLSVRNHEILRSNNRDLSGINKDFLCVKGRFGFDFTQHKERIHQRLANAFFVLREIEAEAAFDAQKIFVDAGEVAIVRAHDFVIAHAERDFAAIGAVRAGGRDIFHFPGARFISIRAAGERADGANIDAHAAFFAFQVIFAIGDDHAIGAAQSDAESLHVHAFIADAH